MARIGVFTSAADNAVMGAASRAFLDEMRKLGFAEGQNLRVEPRHTERDSTALSAGWKADIGGQAVSTDL